MDEMRPSGTSRFGFLVSSAMVAWWPSCQTPCRTSTRRGTEDATGTEGEEGRREVGGLDVREPRGQQMMAMPTTNAIELMVVVRRAPDTASAEVVHRTTTSIGSSRLKPSASVGMCARAKGSCCDAHACLRAPVHVPCTVRTDCGGGPGGVSAAGAVSIPR
jgi:hypothetical protein